MAAKLYITIRSKEIEHTGYCSDPGSDTGEETTEVIKLELTNEEVDFIKKNKIIDEYGDGNLELAKKHKFQKVIDYNEGRFVCSKGSGYCGYKGYCFVKSFEVRFPINQ
tara:strand:- start:45 stop:371 length:327 start_codon:yes stop_codon:yes gene_type:complete